MKVSPRQREVLNILAQREEWSVGEIAPVLGVSNVAVTKMIARLARLGFVRCGVDYEDRRRVLVTLTRLGKHSVQQSVSNLVRS